MFKNAKEKVVGFYGEYEPIIKVVGAWIGVAAVVVGIGQKANEFNNNYAIRKGVIVIDEK